MLLALLNEAGVRNLLEWPYTSARPDRIGNWVTRQGPPGTLQTLKEDSETAMPEIAVGVFAFFPNSSGWYKVLMAVDIVLDRVRLADLCRRYHVAKLELFGSRAKGTAGPESDVDLLVTFEEGQTPGLEFLRFVRSLRRSLGATWTC